MGRLRGVVQHPTLSLDLRREAANATPEMVDAIYNSPNCPVMTPSECARVLKIAFAAAPPDDRDARIAELEQANGLHIAHDQHANSLICRLSKERDELKQQLEQMTADCGDAIAHAKHYQAKCPPDDVLEWLHWCLSGAIMKPEVTNRASQKYAEWQAWKAAPVDIPAVHVPASEWAAENRQAEEQGFIVDYAPVSVDKTKPPGWGDCLECVTFTPDGEVPVPCKTCKHGYKEQTEDNWTPKEGVK